MSRVDKILQEIGNELAFVKSTSLETFAAQLQKEDQTVTAPTV